MYGPLQLQPGHEAAVTVEDVHHVSDGEEDHEGVVDGEEPVTTTYPRHVGGRVCPHVRHLHPRGPVPPAARQLHAPLVKLVSPP